jgi:hypothetical protein
LRLLAIATGRGANIDVRALDDELTTADVQRVAGPQAELIMRTVGDVGPERLLDLALRGGPYGLTLARVKAAPGGIDLGALEPRIPEMLRTASGKIELAPSMLLDDLGRARADLDRAVPDLVLVGRRQLRSNNSWMHNLPMLAKGPFRCVALVNPVDAARLGLVDGGRARIANGARSIDVVVEITDEMRPGVVSLPHGWGHDQPGARMAVAAERPGANINAILDETQRDPLSGNAVLSGVAITMQAR